MLKWNFYYCCVFILLSIGFITMIAEARTYGSGIYGTCKYGVDCTVVTPPEINEIPSTQPSITNGACLPNQQVYNGGCYDCDPTKGFLKVSLNSSNETNVYCILCGPDSIKFNNTCIPKYQYNHYNITGNSTGIEKMLSDTGSYLTNLFESSKINPATGFSLLAASGAISLALYYYDKGKKEKKKKEEGKDEGERIQSNSD